MREATMSYTTPTDWKSEKWWQNRSVDERLFHIRPPKRFVADTDVRLPPGAASWVDQFKVGDNLLIHGRTGTGKTTIAVAAARELVRRNSVSARYVDADDYVEMIKESFDYGGQLPEMYSTPHLLKYLKNTFDVVVLDNLGQERMTEFSSHTISGLIKKRFDQMRSMIIVSPYNVLDINRRYDQFTASALAEYSVVSL
jgi:DNA replication protein DnaC